MTTALKRAIGITALISIVILSALGLVDRGLSKCGLGYLDQTNTHYLDSAFEKSLTGFLLLSTIKSGLAVVEGSEVGVGFNLEVGDIVQPVYDYIDIAWRAALAGGSVIVAMQLALNGLHLIDHWALTALGLILLGHYLAMWTLPKKIRLHNGLNEAARFGASLCVTLYLLLPLSVTSAAALSQKITRPMVESSHEELKAIGSTLSPEHFGQHFMTGANGQGITVKDLRSALANAGRGVEALVTFLKTETEHLAALTIKLVAAYLFDCLLFPLFFALLFVTVLKNGMRYLFEFDRPQSGGAALLMEHRERR